MTVCDAARLSMKIDMEDSAFRIAAPGSEGGRWDREVE